MTEECVQDWRTEACVAHGYCYCGYSDGTSCDYCYNGYGQFDALPEYRLPVHVRYTGTSLIRHLDDRCRRFGLDVEVAAKELWLELSEFLALDYCRRDREVYLYATASDVCLPFSSLNTEEHGLRSPVSTDPGLTGAAQAALIVQEATASALLEACRHIEENNCSQFAFTCREGRHNSVGCVCLLSSLVYHNAALVFTSLSTQRVASRVFVAA